MNIKIMEPRCAPSCGVAVPTSNFEYVKSIHFFLLQCQKSTRLNLASGTRLVDTTVSVLQPVWVSRENQEAKHLPCHTYCLI